MYACMYVLGKISTSARVRFPEKADTFLRSVRTGAGLPTLSGLLAKDCAAASQALLREVDLSSPSSGDQEWNCCISPPLCAFRAW